MLNISDVVDSLIYTQWALARMDSEDFGFQKMVDARNNISDVIVDYVKHLEEKCKNTPGQ